MKCIILARVSSKEQEENNSIPSQIRRLNEYAERNNLEILKTFRIVESSLKSNRTQFNEMLKFVKQQKKTIAIITDTIDRIQRSFRESNILEELRNSGKIEIHFLRENLIISKNSNSSEILRWDIGVVLAKSYVSQLSDNVKRSLEQKRINGEWGGKAPFGYKNTVRNDGSRWVEADPLTAEIVRDVFKMYALESNSIKTVSDKIFKKYNIHKTPSTIHRMLHNPFYYGEMQTKGELRKHIYEPLISRELFSLAHTKLHKIKKEPVRYAGLPFHYRGMIKCADCGCSITPERSKGLVYYHCTGKREKHKTKWIREEDLTEQIVRYLSRIQPTKEQFEQVIETAKKSNDSIRKNIKQQKKILNAELSKIEARINRLQDLYLDGDISKEDYKKKIKEISRSRAIFKEKLNNIDESHLKFYENITTLMGIALNATEIFESSNIDERRQILDFVCQNLQLKDGKLLLKYKKPFDKMVFFKNNSAWLGWRDSNPRMPGPKPGALPLGDIPIPNYFNKYYSKNQVLSWTFFCNFTSIAGYSLEYISFSNIPVQDFWHIIIPIL